MLLKAHLAKHLDDHLPKQAVTSASFGTGVSDYSSGDGGGCDTRGPITDAVMKGTAGDWLEDSVPKKRSRGCGALEGREQLKQETGSRDLRRAVEGIVGLASIEEGLFRHVVLTL